ncbi:MAG: hypothetical protein HOV78_20390 [Hamadaea sp.]|nr:hypothetical protein [Hamadaea sp.]NUO90641.1 hypothetical protein [Dermatophilaceae bacterium]
MPGQNILALALLVAVFVAIVVLAFKPAPAEKPAEPEPAEPKTCQLRFLGRICGVVAYFHDRHIDGTWVWTCTGCHDRGVAHGYLNNDPKDVTL